MFQLPFMVQALVACLLLTVILSYFGVHVVSRGIVFIDLALAQISSAGVAFALLTGGDLRLYALAFTLVGALVMAFLPKSPRVPQEAIIGIIYAVASAAAILMLSKTAHADSDVTEILFGNILAITPNQIMEMAITFGMVGVFHAICYKRFNTLSLAQTSSKTRTIPDINFWNLLFYLSLALVISEAIRAAGVLLVFTYLIVPAVSALLLYQKTLTVLVISLLIGIIASLMGLYGSYTYDLPTGASIVACFGIVFSLALTVSAWSTRKQPIH